MCLCMYMHMCVHGVQFMCVHVPVSVRPEGILGFFENRFIIVLELAKQTRLADQGSPRGSDCLHLPAQGSHAATMSSLFVFPWVCGMKLRSACFQSMYFTD